MFASSFRSLNWFAALSQDSCGNDQTKHKKNIKIKFGLFLCMVILHICSTGEQLRLLMLRLQLVLTCSTWLSQVNPLSANTWTHTSHSALLGRRSCIFILKEYGMRAHSMPHPDKSFADSYRCIYIYMCICICVLVGTENSYHLFFLVLLCITIVRTNQLNTYKPKQAQYLAHEHVPFGRLRCRWNSLWWAEHINKSWQATGLMLRGCKWGTLIYSRLLATTVCCFYEVLLPGTCYLRRLTWVLLSILYDQLPTTIYFLPPP